MVKVERVSFVYQVNGKVFPILRNISFNLERGGILCIIGPSGCGKTTLLFNIAGLRSPDTGLVYVDGEPVRKPRERTSTIFQHFGLLPWKTVLENVSLGLKIRGLPNDQINRSVRPGLEHLGIAHLADKYPKHLSGGEKQRVAIARALVLKPDLLLLDEPFSAIDALNRESLQELLLRVWKEWDLTIVHVTHDIEEAVFLGTEIIALTRDGSIYKSYTLTEEKSADFRNSLAFHEATGILRDYMRKIIDETTL
jgi:ABC-type nitrate/sulfonate/bicarbonate transport system ATPase subunit